MLNASHKFPGVCVAPNVGTTHDKMLKGDIHLIP